jgi:thiamine kinase-like enzyme
VLPEVLMGEVEANALVRCQEVLPGWRHLGITDFDFAPPKGFSTFTMGIQARTHAEPPAILYRQLEGKENAILDFEDERRVYLALADAGVATCCYAYEQDFRLEGFYAGRALTAADLTQHEILGLIGEQLAHFHRLAPELPPEPFFDRLHARWGPMARRVLTSERHRFAAHEHEMCERLMRILEPATLEMVRRCLPDEPLVFCHNDAYHGNMFLLDTGEVRLLDFEFSCLNHRAFDFANLFAETKMRHKLPEYPYFGIAEPTYSRDDIGALVDGYLNACPDKPSDRETLIDQTLDMILLSDFMYAMAALPLAVEPIQKIQFIPYALQRFERFVTEWEKRFA